MLLVRYLKLPLHLELEVQPFRQLVLPKPLVWQNQLSVSSLVLSLHSQLQLLLRYSLATVPFQLPVFMKCNPCQSVSVGYIRLEYGM
jgi:hypothetical protein